MKTRYTFAAGLLTTLLTLAITLSVPLATGIATAAPLMYVPTGPTNEVLVIDLHTDRIVQRIAGLENAHGLAGNARAFYLVAGSMQPQGTGENGAKPAAENDDAHAAHHGKAAGAAATSPSATPFVTLIDRRTRKITRRIGVPGLTHHTAVSPDGEYAAAVHPGKGAVSIIDLDEQRVIENIAVGAGPNFALFGHRDGRLYISNTRDGSISVIDTRQWRRLGDIDVGGEPEHMALSADGNRLYVVDVGNGKVLEVDLPGAAVRTIYPVGTAPHAVDVSTDRRWLFVSVRGENRLVRIDQESGARLSVDLPPAPYHLEYAEVVDKLYVSSRKLPRIWVLDPRTLAVRGTIDLGRGVGHQMVVIPE